MGETVVCGGIHISDIPEYSWGKMARKGRCKTKSQRARHQAGRRIEKDMGAYRALKNRNSLKENLIHRGGKGHE